MGDVLKVLDKWRLERYHLSTTAVQGFCGSSRFFLKAPDPVDYKFFWSALKSLSAKKEIATVTVMWKFFKEFKKVQEFGRDVDLPRDSTLHDCMAFIPDNVVDNGEAVTDKIKYMPGGLDGAWLYFGEDVGYWPEAFIFDFIRADFENWDKDLCLIRHMFFYGTGGKEYEEPPEIFPVTVPIEEAKTADDVIDCVIADWNKNWIVGYNKKYVLCSKNICHALKLLVPTQEPGTTEWNEKVNGAVLLINNVLACFIRQGRNELIAKIPGRDILDNSPIVVMQTFSPEGVKAATAWTFDFMSEKGKTKTRHWYDIWKEHPARGICYGETFLPWTIKDGELCDEEQENDGRCYNYQRVINRFPGYRWEYNELRLAADTEEGKKGVQELLKLIKEGFCCKSDKYANYFLYWLAWPVQFPADKTGIAVIVKSLKGVGKGLLSNILKIFWGPSFVKLGGRALNQNFNQHLTDKIVIWMDELNAATADKPNVDVMKGYVTEATTVTEKKHHDARETINLCNVIAATNNELGPILDVTEDNRRFWIIESDITVQELRTWRLWVDTLWDSWVGPTATANNFLKIRAFFYFLAELKFPEAPDPNNPVWRPNSTGVMPMTEYMSKLLESGLGIVAKWWKYVLERRHLTDTDAEMMPCNLVFDDLKKFETIFKGCKSFEELYGLRREMQAVTSRDFLASFRELARTKESRRPGSFVLEDWVTQIQHWNRKYPFAVINFKDGEVTNPFSTSAIAHLKSNTPISHEIRSLTDEECRLALQVVKNRYSDSFAVKSIMNRPDQDDQDSLITFIENEENPNKRRRT